MSIEHWQDDNGRKAIKRMGWPEWENDYDAVMVDAILAVEGE